MRTVLMALVVLWLCNLTVVLPVILGQQAKDNLDREKEQDSPHGNSTVSNSNNRSSHFYINNISSNISSNSSHSNRGRYKSGRFKSRTSGWYSRGDNDVLSQLVLSVSAPDLFEDITVVVTQVSEFLSPGFVIQRVQGNVSWLEEVSDQRLDCFYSGIVLEDEHGSSVAISTCDGV
ncbi:unnamed protein product, partial [Candidula unifasciata]